MADDLVFDFTDEQWDAVIEFIMHYDKRYYHATSGWGRAQRALIRRMLLDVGVEFDIVYDCETACLSTDEG